MKKITKILVCGVSLICCGNTGANADSLKDLLGGDWGKKLGGVVQETVAQNQSKSLEVADLEGEWQTTGPAVSLRSDNILEQAGGATISGMAEEKIRPYYDKLGLDNSTITFDEAGSFVLKIKKLPVKGVLKKNDDGSFEMQFTSGIGKLKGKNRSLTAYVLKSGTTLSITVDVKKLLDIVGTVAAKTDLKTISTAAGLLKNYDNVCVGLRMTGK